MPGGRPAACLACATLAGNARGPLALPAAPPLPGGEGGQPGEQGAKVAKGAGRRADTFNQEGFTLLTRIFLGVNAAMFIGYGLYCFFVPEKVGNLAGLQAQSADGRVELRAMYGGLQTAVGVLALCGLLRPALQLPALTGLFFIFTGLACARVLGVFMDDGTGSYTTGVIALEVVFALVAFVLLRRN